MNEIVETIRTIRIQRKQLEEKEKDILNTISFPKIPIQTIKNLFLELKKTDKFENMEQKKMFIYICISIVCPTFAIGDRLPYSVRKNLSHCTGIHPVQISYISRSVIIYYSRYKVFKAEADYLYNSIKRSLTL